MKKHRVLKTICVFAVLLALCTAVSFYVSNNCLQTKEYKISADVNGGIRVALLADLHNNSFGKGNSRLIKRVADASPDVIFFAGDLVNMHSSEYAVAVELVAALTDIAPVYVSPGNHDVAFEKNFEIDFASLFEDAGATVLDKEYLDIELSSTPVRIGGIYGYCLPPDVSGNVDEQCEFLTDFSDTDALTLLLCHMPAAFLEWGSLDAWDIDVVLCGHAHGGQVRLPFAGGLYAPDQGWFPGDVSGLYYGERGNVLVLSRGLGGNIPVPRFNNIPQVIIVDLESNVGETNR